MKLSQLSLADYNQLDSIPVINQDLSATDFTPVANTYYRHTGATTATFTQGVIYCYNGTEYKALDGSGGDIIKSQTFNIQRVTSEKYDTIKELAPRMLYATIKNTNASTKLDVTVKNVSFDSWAKRICFFNIEAPLYPETNDTVIHSYTFAENVGWTHIKTTINTAYTTTKETNNTYNENSCEVTIYYI